MMEKYYFKIPSSVFVPMLMIFCSLFLLGCGGQSEIGTNKYGLTLLSTAKQYKASIKNNPEHRLVNLIKADPALKFDFVYSTPNNFVGQILYPQIQTTYLRKKAADALGEAHKSLQKKGYGLLIWDAYRPYAVTEKMWEIVPDSRYAADPKFGSGHNRGISVDLTLLDNKSGAYLDMGTGFDNFSDTAHIGFTHLPKQILENRKILQEAMEAAGFIVLDTEWWHFYLPDSKSYPLMNLSFLEIEKLF